MRRYTFRLSLVGLLFLPFGCAMDPGKMVPEMSVQSTPKFSQSLRIGDVTGAEKEVFSGPAYIQADEFREALLLTVTESALFDRVAVDGPQDLTLDAKFVVQGQTTKGLSFFSSMVIEYTLVESKSGNVLWSEGFNSTAKRTLADDFAGGTRSTNAQIYCAKANLKQLVEALSNLQIP